MELNHDCVREVLLYIEEQQPVGKKMYWKDFSHEFDSTYDQSKIEDFSDDDLRYCLERLIDAQYLDGDYSLSAEGTLVSLTVKNITWEGHTFLDNIRDPEIWKDTKTVVSHLKSVSIGMLSEISTTILKKLIMDRIFPSWVDW